ncbi:MAG: imidazole glycerol phosphate synthase subunit HisH [Nitrospirae bacterium]|nr:imidazole glycerol phosphate synthase subunit HisH [Nitrospirota bacterium]
MARVVIIDYDRGNLRSVQKGFERVGFSAAISRDPQIIADASHVVLPGVGAFGDCMDNLERFGLIDPVTDAVRAGKPFLGICLGLQLLFSESEEFGDRKGLGIIPGRVRAFPAGMLRDGERLKVPHMGWNRLHMTRRPPVFADLDEGAHVYFVHSFHVVPDDLDVVASTTQYGVLFVSSIWKDNVVACQFHPEKSDKAGLAMLRNFAQWKG